MLSLTRKVGLFAVLAHQTWSQASRRMRGALQNVGLEVAFRLGRQDAEYAAADFGSVNRAVDQAPGRRSRRGRTRSSALRTADGTVGALDPDRCRSCPTATPSCANGTAGSNASRALPVPIRWASSGELATIEELYLRALLSTARSRRARSRRTWSKRRETCQLAAG